MTTDNDFYPIEIPAATTIAQLGEIARVLACKVVCTDSLTIRLEPDNTQSTGGYQPRPGAAGAVPPKAE